MKEKNNSLYTFIPLEDFKALLCIDDREDKNARFCLVTAALTIEQYCKRKFLRKKYIEKIDFYGDLLLPLTEYPVSKIISLYTFCGNSYVGEILEPEFYSTLPDCGIDIDLPFFISLSPALKRYRALKAIKVIYWSGYPLGKVPADLASACLELAAWNLNRYKGRHIGFTGNVKGKGREGQHFEISMPENVKELLEPYRRKTI